MTTPIVNQQAVALTAAFNSKLSAQLDKACALVTQAEATDRVELDEFYFSAFLPFFAGDEKLMYPVTIETWINVAGGMFNEVDVVKKVGGKKTVIFTVPAVMNRLMYKPTMSKRGEPSIYGAVLNTQNIANMNPAQAEMYLRNHLSKREQRGRMPETMIANAEAWNKIFAYYGRPPMVPSVATPGAGDEVKEEVLGFDPL